MAIAVPTGVKIFNWIGTLWGGQIMMRTPMMFALGFVWMFMIGGFSGVMHSAAPADAQQQDSYFVIAHFHYVLIGGSIFALLAGHPLLVPADVRPQGARVLGQALLLGHLRRLQLTFFPMHFLGLNGMPRRTFTYDSEHGLEQGNCHRHPRRLPARRRHLHLLRVLVYTYFKGKGRRQRPVGRPHARVVHPLPPPEHNFAVIPTVHARDAWWYEKHHKEEIAKEKAAHAKAEESHGGIHMPFHPSGRFVASFGLLIGGQLRPTIFTRWWFGNQVSVPPSSPLAIAGGVIMLIGIYLLVPGRQRRLPPPPRRRQGHRVAATPLRK
jgi:cytochrome c oxidase subunit 1